MGSFPPVGLFIFVSPSCSCKIENQIAISRFLPKILFLREGCNGKENKGYYMVELLRFPILRIIESNHLLNTSRDGDSTTSLGSLLQCFTALSVKKFFLTSSRNFPCCNLRLFPSVTCYLGDSLPSDSCRK